MIAVLSPAKTLDYATPFPAVQPTRPHFIADATNLAAAAAKLGNKRLGALMKISPTLAKLNDERFKTFADQPTRPAVYAFAGDVYTGFELARASASVMSGSE